MEYFGNPGNLKLLQSLLSEPVEHSSDEEPDDRVPTFEAKFTTPSSVSTTQGQSPDEQAEAANAVESKPPNVPIIRQRMQNIDLNTPTTLSEWEAQERLLNDELEERLTPEYRIVYKQSVTPEDIYLQMGNKTTATASCEEMCLEIQMPKETVSIDRMELDVTPNEIDLKTQIYRLKLPLVQPIDPDRGNAKWDDRAKILRLNLRMKREYDFINF